MSKPITISCTILLSLLTTSYVSAACTYSEAMMALGNGNSVRGEALMRMAARDGDLRATRYMASFEYSNKLKASHISQSINKSDLEPKHVDGTTLDGKQYIYTASKLRSGEKNPGSNVRLVTDAEASTQVVN